MKIAPIDTKCKSDSALQDEAFEGWQLARKVAEEYSSRGWKPVPISFRKKHPDGTAWQFTEYKPENFKPCHHRNIGVQLGPDSNGLGDVDLDCEEARALAAAFLPETDAIFGRKSTPNAHRLYKSDLWKQVEMAVTPFEDPTVSAAKDNERDHGAMLVELRTGRIEKSQVKGAASMFPPSTHHPSGELVRWDRDGEPAQVEGLALLQAVSNLAAASLLLRYYPRKGLRHKVGLRLGGWLARAGWDEDRIAHFVKAIALAAGDDEWQERVDSAKAAVTKHAEGKHMPGATKMRELFGDAVVTKVAEWLQIDNGGFQSASSSASDQQASAAPARKQSTAQPSPRTIDEVIATFDKWLVLQSRTPLYAMLGAIAANLLEGEPVWLGIVGPPSSAKTELLNATSRLPYVTRAATLTCPALLSGTPARQRTRGASGGLLRQIGDFGILMHKDFGSILSMRQEARAEVIAALREIYDGDWTRHLGSDGGMSLSWQGKAGLLFGVTGVIDQHYSVIGSMGDRFLLTRISPVKGQLRQALKHRGELGKVMRAELAEAVAGLFASQLLTPPELTPKEVDHLDKLTALVVRLRGAVVRDHYSKEIEAVLGEEGQGRLGMTLERLLAGLHSLGVERATAMKVVDEVAYDSVPPLCGRVDLPRVDQLDGDQGADTTDRATAFAPRGCGRGGITESSKKGIEMSNKRLDDARREP
jgi:hypothetical protein